MPDAADLVDRDCTCCGDPILALPDEEEPVCMDCVPHSMYGD